MPISEARQRAVIWSKQELRRKSLRQQRALQNLP